ncbi:MAG TPA: hypothetical protein VG899_01870 [Mycobacteriales bacterium]|nr:hypothetical protein [Mycobacteriales bacterium]
MVPAPRTRSASARLSGIALAAALALGGVTACASSSGPVAPEAGSSSGSTAQTIAQVAFALAGEDSRPARRLAYLAPLLRLQRHCTDADPVALKAVVERLAVSLGVLGVTAPRAAAEAVLAADASRNTNCGALTARITRELGKPAVASRGRWDGGTTYLTFAPTVTAAVALAVIRRRLLPGPEHQVYALTASGCQQAVYLGPALARLTGSSALGAFVELTSGHGVGRTRYDAARVDRARITVLGAIGGQPCT